MILLSFQLIFADSESNKIGKFQVLFYAFITNRSHSVRDYSCSSAGPLSRKMRYHSLRGLVATRMPSRRAVLEVITGVRSKKRKRSRPDLTGKRRNPRALTEQRNSAFVSKDVVIPNDVWLCRVEDSLDRETNKRTGQGVALLHRKSASAATILVGHFVRTQLPYSILPYCVHFHRVFDQN